MTSLISFIYKDAKTLENNEDYEVMMMTIRRGVVWIYITDDEDHVDHDDHDVDHDHDNQEGGGLDMHYRR